MKKMLLKEICEIRTGYQGKKEAGTMYRLINPTDLNSDGIIDIKTTKTFGDSKIHSKFVIKNREIIFKAKSSHYSVGVFKNHPENCVPSGHFFILNINHEQIGKIHPEYISWYLSQEEAQRRFKRLATGMAMPTVRKSDLEDLVVTVPPLEIQNKIIKIHELSLKEKMLFEELLELRKLQTKNALNNLINQEDL
ncbi:restriction endonuclease subunit S [Priestia aryabhattai]|uniref:restriction endonuclease subunit S n=1 Tax=Priestia aryabhattai TaxID=412384 RepID=UPI0023B1A26F|nr:restriction endonuclease subunit S [Priestia aryabhattai]MDE8676558.1 restriction endonuclease subunit S [Priestia aryabhattai]